MNDMMEFNGGEHMAESIYFAPLLPWHQALWSQLTTRVTAQQSLPHALLAAGMQGMGKRAFVWRLVAWLLCHQRATHPQGACAECESCQWLKSGTHPNLQTLPLVSMPVSVESADAKEKSSSSAKSKKSTKAASNSALKIKVDDIRALQPFIYQGGQGLRICVLDQAEKMTVAAANALLKTLEEPQAQVHLFLISDAPAQLLPTIKSRVQQLALQTIQPTVAIDYVTETLGSIVNREAVGTAEIAQLIQLANGAPLAAIALANTPWYSKRDMWIVTWQALRSGKRSSVAASDYWQKQLGIVEFTQLSELMMLDMRRICLGLNALQKDIDLSAITDGYEPDSGMLETFSKSLQQTKIALQQNVQEKFAYDKLMQELANL
ncbi:DNA polymerase III subunit delta' [Psychrobacter sp.]|uniref:DNA polymerase III subunit delta' n=1 Tax=Psychrobacter sp. TaxID=56811 RepID=UPI003F95671A